MYLFIGLAIVVILCLCLGRLSHAGQPRCIEDAPPGSILIYHGHANVRYLECSPAQAGLVSQDDFVDGYFLNPEVYRVEAKDGDGNVFTFFRSQE